MSNWMVEFKERPGTKVEADFWEDLDNGWVHFLKGNPGDEKKLVVISFRTDAIISIKNLETETGQVFTLRDPEIKTGSKCKNPNCKCA